MVNRWAVTSYNAGPTLKGEFPEIAEVSRCLRFENNTVKIGERIFKNEKVYISEPSLFKIFSISLLKGDPDNVLLCSGGLAQAPKMVAPGPSDPVDRRMPLGGVCPRRRPRVYERDIPAVRV